MNADLDYLYAHHAVGLCPEERCVSARANLAALVGTVSVEAHREEFVRLIFAALVAAEEKGEAGS